MNKKPKTKQTEPPYYHLTKDIGNYIVYGDGRVWSKHKKVFMKTSTDKHGYLQNIINDKCKRVHRIVAETFIPNPLGLPEIDHINDNKLDNRVENLQWITRGDNIRKSHLNSPRRGILHGRVKLTEEEARAIKYDYPHLKNNQIAKLYPKVTSTAINRIKKGERWAHI